MTQRFYVEAIVAVDEHADEHLQTRDGVRAELTSWLSDLGAAIELISIRAADEADGKE